MPKLRLRLALACLAVCLLGIAAHGPIFTMAFHWLDVGTPPEKSDAVFVFFGNNDTRPYVAAALYNAGYADEILMARDSTNEFNPQHRPAELVYRTVITSRGVPQDRVHSLGDHGIRNTMTESRVLGEYLTENPDAVVTVVTSNFHTRRTRWSLRRHLGSQADRLRFVSAPEDNFGPNDWWLYAEGFELVWTEFIKLAGYWLFYGRPWRYLLAGFVLLIGSWYALRRRKSIYGHGGDTAEQAPAST